MKFGMCHVNFIGRARKIRRSNKGLNNSRFRIFIKFGPCDDFILEGKAFSTRKTKFWILTGIPPLCICTYYTQISVIYYRATKFRTISTTKTSNTPQIFTISTNNFLSASLWLMKKNQAIIKRDKIRRNTKNQKVQSLTCNFNFSHIC